MVDESGYHALSPFGAVVEASASCWSADLIYEEL